MLIKLNPYLTTHNSVRLFLVIPIFNKNSITQYLSLTKPPPLALPGFPNTLPSMWCPSNYNFMTLGRNCFTGLGRYVQVFLVLGVEFGVLIG